MQMGMRMRGREWEREGVRIRAPLEVRAGRLNLRLYHLGSPVPLSQSLPMLEKMGVKVMGQVSSLGADAKSRQLYLRTKGRAEEMLTQRGFDSLVIVRPSLLDTPPRADWRPGERIALALSRVLRPLIPRRYRPVKAEAVARALLEATLAAQPGVRVIESEELA